MKKIISTMIMAMALFGCEDATKAIDQAQEAANKAVDSVQEQIDIIQDHVDSVDFNLEQFGEATESAQALAASVEEALDADFSDPEALVEAKDDIANAYRCLVEASSESTVEKMMDNILASISNDEAKSLIKKGIDKAKAASECVM
ncbi:MULTISPECIES: hypothetical protein [Vibrio]|jgi:prefoldin subunit 5|uniref:hypothetical protein n=1 Tax=Vibrio TaxID=662 RepID=UPI000BFFE6DA|nr:MULTISPECIES: hypothetical protein [unclassified Vibrio]PHJ43054.1 hypothetical protein AK965_03080 [Vibrio sp. PID17_43]RIZ53547.1 hypothetical protein AK966_12655 [Vibrio sp. PID23_8]